MFKQTLRMIINIQKLTQISNFIFCSTNVVSNGPDILLDVKVVGFGHQYSLLVVL